MSPGRSAETTYEVYVFQGGKWQLHARFGRSEKARALAEAKNLDKQSFVQSVKVVKEAYDPDLGTSEETTVYRSSKGKVEFGQGPSGRGVTHADQRRSGARGVVIANEQASGPRGVVFTGEYGYHGRGGDDYSHQYLEDDEDDGEGTPRSRLGLVTKVLLITLFSVAVAALLTGILSMLATRTDILAGLVGRDGFAHVLFLVFVVCFAGSAITMGMVFIDKRDLDATPDIQLPIKRSKKPIKTFAEEALEDLDKGIDDLVPLDADAPAPSEGATDGAASAETPDMAALIEAEKQRIEGGDEAGAEQAGEKVPTFAEVEAPAIEAGKLVMLNFLSRSLRAVQAKRPKLDNYNKFGINLFLAGASESLGAERSLSRLGQSTILAEAVKVIGTRDKVAQSFAERYDTYLVTDARYLEIFQAGRYALSTFALDEEAAVGLLDKALDGWNKPRPVEEHSGPITVMFTDLVGSTALTQARGDQGAQELVRTHNRIVREALQRHRGEEVKHTGDGIMASFKITADGVDAAVTIQQQTRTHNVIAPDKQLHIRIGINAGRPIAEEGDLFGSTVQMAARICDKAETDRIMISEVVQDICAGKGYVFIDKGLFELKGFKEQSRLFDVVWDPEEAEAVRAKQKAAPAQPEPAKEPVKEEPATPAQPQPAQPQPEQPQPEPPQPEPPKGPQPLELVSFDDKPAGRPS